MPCSQKFWNVGGQTPRVRSASCTRYNPCSSPLPIACPLTSPRTVYALIAAAGWPIWFLLATSIVCLALIIERLLSLRRARVLPAHLAARVAELARQGEPAPHVLHTLAQNSPLGRVLAEVLSQRGAPARVRLAAIEAIGRDVAVQLNRYLPALGTIAVVAPLLGLFGTVIGMIEIFSAFNPAGADPTQLARGISVALYNTAFGILIAIPALVCHRLLRARVDGFLHRLEREAMVLDRVLAQAVTAHAVT